MIPTCLRGGNPLVTGLLLVALLTVVIIVFVYGYDRRSLVAVLGSMLGTVTACGLGMLFTRLLRIHGAVMSDSETLLYANGDGSYTVSLAAMDMNVKDTQIHSEWSGSYRLRPEANGLAYSECSGKAFTVDGSFGGPSIFSLTSSSQTMQATKMSHQLSNGKYLFAGQVLTGTIVARLTGINDYNTSYYVSPEVKVTWTYDEEKNSLSQKVEYNGQTM